MRRQRLSRTSRSFWPVLVLLAALLVTLLPAPASGAEGVLSGELICLDPGHGGTDPGAVNVALQEKDINLDVSKALGWLLEQEGAEVVMTRYDDAYLTNRDRYTFCNDMKATLLISVHTNSYTDATWDGSTTLWSKRADQALAQAIHDVLYPELKISAPDPATFRDFGLTKFQSGVLLKSDMPAAMMEPVFMSNSGEAARLGQSVYDSEAGTISQDCLDNTSCRRGQIVQAIYHGILNYYGYPPTPEPGGKMHVAGIEMSYLENRANYSVTTQVTVVGGSTEDAADPVSGVTVSLITTLPNGRTVSSAATTDSYGVATFTVISRATGSYRSEVTSVSKPGWTWDPGAGDPTSSSLEVP